MLTRIGTTLEKLAAEKPVLLAFCVFLCVAALVIPASLPTYLAHGNDFYENVLAEAHGMLFDLLIIGCLLLWLNKRAETRLTNNRYQEEIEDFLGWQSPEATHRIAGNIRRLNRSGVRDHLKLTHAYLRGANLGGASLHAADLWGADLQGATLGGANLRRASLAGANLIDADLERATLRGADLRGAELIGVDLERSDASEVDFRGAIMQGADFQYADLRRANLERCELSEANLREALLEGANLRRATLRDASLRGADLRGADLRGAMLAGADLERADLAGARLPDGEAAVALFANVRSLFQTRLDPSVAEAVRAANPELFNLAPDSEIY